METLPNLNPQPPDPSDLSPLFDSLDLSLPTRTRTTALSQLALLHAHFPHAVELGYHTQTRARMMRHTPDTCRQAFSTNAAMQPLLPRATANGLLINGLLESLPDVVDELRQMLRSRAGPGTGTEGAGSQARVAAGPLQWGPEVFLGPFDQGGATPTEAGMSGSAPTTAEGEEAERSASARKVDSQYTEALLEMLSSGTANPTVRAKVAAKMGPWLLRCWTDTACVQRTLTRLVLVKAGLEEQAGFATSAGLEAIVQDLAGAWEWTGDRWKGRGADGILEPEEQVREARSREVRMTVETLAYLSRRRDVKARLLGGGAGGDQILSSTRSIACIRGVLADENDSDDAASAEAVFGCLSILDNLTTYPPRLSEEQSKLAALKEYANGPKAGAAAPGSTPEPDPPIDGRNGIVMASDLVPALIRRGRSTTITHAARFLILSILLSLSKQAPHRRELVPLGALKLILGLLPSLSPADNTAPNTTTPTTIPASSSPATTESLFTATLTLARLLIATNPSHATSSASAPLLTAIRPLLLLLDRSSPRSIYPEKYRSDLLPQFESLLALTNLASAPAPDGSDVRAHIVRHGFGALAEELLLSANAQVQRATVELLCNLMQDAGCVEKFADGTQAGRQRLKVLVALTDAEDAKTRLAAAGAVAMFSEWGQIACAALVGEELVVRRLEGILVEGNDFGLIHRALVILLNLMSAEGECGRAAVDVFGARPVMLLKLEELRRLGSGAGAGSPVVDLAQQCLSRLGKPYMV